MTLLHSSLKSSPQRKPLADLKTKKAELKSIDKEIARIEAKKVKAETKAAESAKKAEAEDVLKKLLASGVSADEILEKLK